MRRMKVDALKQAQAAWDALPKEMQKQLFGRPEELDPELKAYLEEDGPFGPSIRHPLVYDIVYSPVKSAHVNGMLRHKKGALAKAQAEENWQTYLYLHERPYRFDAFVEIQDYLSDEQYWELLGDIWIDSENIWQNGQEWVDLMTTEDRPSREHIMGSSDRGLWKLLPDELTVYRGFQFDGGEESLSWTLESDRAVWFAKRHQHKGSAAWVATGKVKKENVIAFFTGRNEAEVVVPWWEVDDLAISEIGEFC